MEALQDRALEATRSRFPDEVYGVGEHAGQKWVDVKRGRIVEILQALRDDLACDFMMDITAVDWLNRGMIERFSVVYILYSTKHNGYFRVRAWVPEDDPSIATVSHLWRSANWGEREVWDMFGITFVGHPDKRRLLMPEDYPGFPLRKDYPLRGHGERYAFPKIERGG